MVFLGDFLQPGKEKRKGRDKRYKGFFLGKKWARLKLPHYEEKKSKFIILRIYQFQKVAKLEEEGENFRIPPLPSSQIWHGHNPPTSQI